MMTMMIVMIMTRGERREILIVQAPLHHHHKAQPQYVRMVQFLRKHFSYLAFVTYRQTYILPSNLPNFNHHCWRRHASNRHKHGNIDIRNWSIANLPKNLHWFRLIPGTLLFCIFKCVSSTAAGTANVATQRFGEFNWIILKSPLWYLCICVFSSDPVVLPTQSL